MMATDEEDWALEVDDVNSDDSDDQPLSQRQILHRRLSVHFDGVKELGLDSQLGAWHDHMIGVVRAEIDELDQREAASDSGDQVSSDPLELAIAELNLPVRTINIFEDDGAVFVRQLVEYTEGEILSLPNAGVKVLADVRSELRRLKLSLREPGRESEILNGDMTPDQIAKSKQRARGEEQRAAARAEQDAQRAVRDRKCALSLAAGATERETDDRGGAHYLKKRIRRRLRAGGEPDAIAMEFGFDPSCREFVSVAKWIGQLAIVRKPKCG